MNILGSAFHIKNSIFIIYLLEDEQELSLGMLIRLQHIYNFLLFHVVILSFLDVLQSFYIIFWYKPIDIVPSASCYFLHVFYIAGNQYQTESKRSETFCGFFWTRRHPVGRRSAWGVLRGEHNPPGHAK